MNLPSSPSRNTGTTTRKPPASLSLSSVLHETFDKAFSSLTPKSCKAKKLKSSHSSLKSSQSSLSSLQTQEEEEYDEDERQTTSLSSQQSTTASSSPFTRSMSTMEQRLQLMKIAIMPYQQQFTTQAIQVSNTSQSYYRTFLRVNSKQSLARTTLITIPWIILFIDQLARMTSNTTLFITILVFVVLYVVQYTDSITRLTNTFVSRIDQVKQHLHDQYDISMQKLQDIRQQQFHIWYTSEVTNLQKDLQHLELHLQETKKQLARQQEQSNSELLEQQEYFEQKIEHVAEEYQHKHEKQIKEIHNQYKEQLKIQKQEYDAMLEQEKATQLSMKQTLNGQALLLQEERRKTHHMNATVKGNEMLRGQNTKLQLQLQTIKRNYQIELQQLEQNSKFAWEYSKRQHHEQNVEYNIENKRLIRTIIQQHLQCQQATRWIVQLLDNMNHVKEGDRELAANEKEHDRCDASIDCNTDINDSRSDIASYKLVQGHVADLKRKLDRQELSFIPSSTSAFNSKMTTKCDETIVDVDGNHESSNHNRSTTSLNARGIQVKTIASTSTVANDNKPSFVMQRRSSQILLSATATAICGGIFLFIPKKR